MYGISRYGESLYASSDLTTGEDSEETYKNIMKIVPDFVSEKQEMNALYVSQGYEVGKLRKNMFKMVDECFVDTGEELLERWEKFFGIDKNNLSIEDKKAQIEAKVRGSRTITVKALKDVVSSFTNSNVEIIEDTAHSKIIICFVGVKGIPSNMKGLISILREIVPAHLQYEFMYYYTTWDELTGKIWDELTGKTWDDMRTMEVV